MKRETERRNAAAVYLMKSNRSYLFKLVLSVLLCVMITSSGLAHGNEKHGGKKTATTPDTAHDTAHAKPQHEHQSAVSPEEHADHQADPATVHAALDDFPNNHPLLVHFPIVLLLVAAALQLSNIFLLKKEFDWLVLIATAIGFSFAFYVSRFAHPHTTGLTEHAELVLRQHDKYAYWTIFLSGASLVSLLLHLFLFKGKRWSTAVAALLLSGAAYTVAMAGHYGAQLVHIEGVGPQGKFLETGHHH